MILRGAALAGLLFGLLPAQAARAELGHFVGSLHSHTSYSDGAGTPAMAYARARDLRRLDFFATSDHAETGLVPPSPVAGAVATTADEWDNTRRQAVDETRAGRFVALRGFEWTGTIGHTSVYFSRHFTGAYTVGGPPTLEAFYRWLQTPPLLGGGADGLATFNHPGYPGGATWNDFRFVPELDDRIVGMELYNGYQPGMGPYTYEPHYVRALDRGWHVGAVGVGDEHLADWGHPRYGKTVFLAPRLTQHDLKESMRARRMYATLDSSLRVSYPGMGSRIASENTSVPLAVHVDGGDVASVDLISNGGAIVASAPGRDLSFTATVTDSERYYFARVTDSTGRRTAYTSPVWVSGTGAAAAFVPRWVAGDFHVHTTYSHDSYGGPTDDNTGPDEAFTLGWTPGDQVAIAESRGLDFFTITDHNDTRGVYDPGFNSDRLTLVPGYENSLAGHAQMIGAVSCYAPEGRLGTLTACSGFPDKRNPLRIKALADALRADGGAFQINHPSDGDWLGAFGDGAAPDPIVPDSVEVWNIGPWHYQPPFPAANDNDFSLRFWETYLNAGFHVAATGGSDNHWRSTAWAQGVGQPTTWVYVTKPGTAGIVEGVRSGRTSISHQPPAYAGPQLFVEADADRDGAFESMVGDTVPAGAPMRIRATNLPPGSFYRIVTDRGHLPIVSPAPETYETTVPEAKWLYVELRLPDSREPRTLVCDPVAGGVTTYCRNRLLLLAITSALYVS